jgi:uncharacterized protein (TIGR03000 family)
MAGLVWLLAAESAPAQRLAPVLLRVTVPDAGARVWIDDHPTQQGGLERLYISPPLPPGRSYSYEVRAAWMQDGRPITQKKHITFRPGETVAVHFTPDQDGDVIVLFDGTSLKNWKKTEFGGQGEVTVEDGKLILEMGADLTGVTWAGPPLPKTNYEVTLEAMKIAGSDFFCGIGFPVGNASASFVAGGWGGGVCGISSIDGAFAADNETATVHSFAKNRWYRFRLRVTPERIMVWLDEEKIVDLATRGRKLSIHPAMEPSLPFGLASYATTAAYRNVKLRKLADDHPAAEPAR